MSIDVDRVPAASFEKSFTTAWNELAPKLRSLIRQFVYRFRVQSWIGQEDEIVEDILQETARRIIERQRKAQHGEAPPIQLFERMAIVTASNFCKDMRRKDRRITRLPGSGKSLLDSVKERGEVDLSEVATERLYLEELFALLAREIVKFPAKQRKVLLIDLANRTSFGTEPTLLQKALLNVGVHLEEYQQKLPEGAKERSRSAALLHYAYRRVSQQAYVREFLAVS